MNLHSINKSFSEKEYEQTLIYIEEYLAEGKMPNDRLMMNYICCLIELEKYEEAYKKINDIRENKPYSLSDYKTISLYIQCGKLDEAISLLNQSHLKDYQMLEIGKVFYFYGLYDSAKDSFLKAKRISHYSDDIVNECDYFLNSINNKHTKGQYISINYNKFKLYHRLHSGYIVYAKNSSEQNMLNSSDNGIYLIWSIRKEGLLTFPLSLAISDEHNVREREFIVNSQKHNNLKDDMRIKNITVKIDYDDIKKVYSKLSKAEYKFATHKIYKKFAFIATEEQLEKNEEFITFFREKVIGIEPKDVVIIIDQKQGKMEDYYILDFNKDDHSYDAVKLKRENNTHNLTDEFKKLGVTTRILDTVKLNDKEKEFFDSLYKEQKEKYKVKEKSINQPNK